MFFKCKLPVSRPNGFSMTKWLRHPELVSGSHLAFKGPMIKIALVWDAETSSA